MRVKGAQGCAQQSMPNHLPAVVGSKFCKYRKKSIGYRQIFARLSAVCQFNCKIEIIITETHAEMSSFGEKKAIALAREQGPGFVEFTRRQLARIYPGGTRIDSSNYDPVALWNAGCQLGMCVWCKGGYHCG